MQVARHKVVSIDYMLTDDDGQTIDSSQGSDPLWYLHGEGNIIPGLEKALEGKSTGDRLQVVVAPVDGYGERQDELKQEVSRDNFKDVEDLEVGMQFRVPADDDVADDDDQDVEDFVVVTVVEIGDEQVTIDGNHELAGINLHFDVTVRDIRDATDEEIEHGHAHAPGGHDH